MRLPSASIVVSVPRERVFAFMRDQARVKRWQPDVIDSRPISGNGLAPGSRWRVTVEEPGRGRFELETWIVAVTENDRLVYAWDEPRSMGEIEYRLGISESGTRIQCTATFHVRGFGRFLAPLAKGFVKRKFAARLKLLGDAVEANERSNPAGI